MKRHHALQSLSRDHHHGLLLSWKIREGFKKGIDPERMMAYALWFWNMHLLKHFEVEERWLFPLLGNDHPLVKRALADHKRITRLFTSAPSDRERVLGQIEEALDKHIRFEERILFQAIQKIATEDQLQIMEQVHAGTVPQEIWGDEFWK